MDLGLSGSGSPSWVDQVAALLASQDLGPFRLAYLESLLVAADWAASASEGGDEDGE
jgi:CRISPR-associated endonuclease/helicase Cas3